MIAPIPLDAGVEVVPRNALHQLGENQLVGSHASLLFPENPEKGADSVEAFSNRARRKLAASRCRRVTSDKSPQTQPDSSGWKLAATV
jgi:hypothetical protein